MPEKSDVPSNFTLKLRKHIRTRRIEAIQQLGVDRIVQITIGSGEATYYLIFEFYAQGNVILTDKSYHVLTLLRSHRDDAKGMATMARHTYPIHTVRLRQPLAFEKFVAALDAAAGAGGGGADRSAGGVPSIEADSKRQDEEEEEDVEIIEDSKSTPATTATTTAAPTGTATRVLKSVVAELVPYGPSVAEHCIRAAGLGPSRSLCTGGNPLTDAEKEALMASVRRFEKWLDGCEDAATPAPGGAILTTASNPAPAPADGKGIASAISGEDQDSSSSNAVYSEYEPLVEDNLPFEQHKNHPGLIKFPTFDSAVSEFYGKLHGQRAIAQQAQREKQAVGKLDAIRRDHELRLEALDTEREAAERRAALIELNLEAVDAALNAVREALAGGMDWNDLGRMIKEEKKGGNPVAALIDSLQLEKNKITLALRDPLEDDSGEEKEAEEEAEVAQEQSNKTKNKMNRKNRNIKGQNMQKLVDRVEVNLDLTAHANARAHYDARKKHADKTRRTLEVSERALIAAEKKAQEALAKVRRTASAKTGAAAAAAAARKPYWFERFHWFISSENYLVLSGRDAQQNELLVKRYLRKGDAYVHADLHGAASTIVKNSDPSMPIPPLTLSQAGQACICRSAAWDAKIITSAYWVHPHQVSKTAPSGEYLTTGSFMIRGRKNYLPPQQLVMGIAWLFKLEEESIKGHLGERAVRLDLFENGDAAGGGGGGGGESIVEEIVEDEEEEEETVKKQEQGTVVSESQSALDAFMDSSVDTLQQQQQQQQPSLGGGGGLSGTAGDSKMEAIFDRYSLGDALPTTNDQIEYLEGDEDSGRDVLDMLGVSRGSGSAAGGGAAAGNGGGSSSRRHLSAKERQLLKKGVNPEDIPAVLQKKKSPSQGQLPEAAKIEQPPAPQQQQQQQGVRGIKGKAAKKNKKYAEQDDDERELAMSLLQSAGQKKDRKQRKDERKAKMAARKAAKTGLTKIEVTKEDIAKLTARLALEPEGEEDDEEEEEVLEGSERASAPGGGEDEERDEVAEQEFKVQIEKFENINDAYDNKNEEIQRERAEVAEILASEGVAMLDDADKERLTQLDELTGMPRPEDVILYAVPVCAPYHVVSHYKYKVKLVPGTLKKGKAFKQSVELLTGRNAVSTSSGRNNAISNGAEGATSLSAADVAAANARELELIRAVAEMDGINAMVGGVKLQVAGLQKMKMAKKKAAGKGKKK